MKRNNATNHIRVATKSPSSEAVDIDSPERALQCTTDDPSRPTPSAAATADQPRQEHTRQACKVATSAADRCCNDSTNNNAVDLQGLLAEVTEELDEANAEAANIDERRQTLLGLPSFMTTSRNDERHPLAFAAELIAEMDMADMDDDVDDGDKSIM